MEIKYTKENVEKVKIEEIETAIADELVDKVMSEILKIK